MLQLVRENPPNLTADDDDPMPATGAKMEQNGHRCIGIFDEGKNVLRALGRGNSCSWSAATLSILFAGGDWKRSVLKDQNKFHMLRTCLQLATTIHIEEWDEFVERDESTGLQYRFMNMHSQPRLGRADEVMDTHVYDPLQAAVDAPKLPDSVLSAFVKAISAIVGANGKDSKDYQKDREIIPYVLHPESLVHVRKHFNEQTLRQEMAYLTNPRQFGAAGKLKSLPWRLALILHNAELGASGTTSEHWERRIKHGAIRSALPVYEYMSQNGAILNARHNLIENIEEFGLAVRLEQRYPLLMRCCREGAACIREVSDLPAQMIPELPQAVAADSRIRFDEWWAGVPVAQRKHVTCIATWCMSQNTTMIVESYQAKAKLIGAEEMTSTTIVDQAVTLLEFAQVAQTIGRLDSRENNTFAK